MSEPRGAGLIRAFETWLELGGEVEDDPAILNRIEAYNQDDCVSNWLLRDWLEEQRSSLSRQLREELPRPQRFDGRAAVHVHLVAGLGYHPRRAAPDDRLDQLTFRLLIGRRRPDPHRHDARHRHDLHGRVPGARQEGLAPD